MRCQYACHSPAHRVARRRFLGGLGAGLGAAWLGGSAGIGGFGALARPAAAEQLQAQQKRVLMIFLSGGSSQLESWDPKPRTETGGPFRAIPTSVPGVHLSELLPKTARQMHRMSIIRSVNTNEDDHGKGRFKMETGRVQTPAAEYPHLGAVMARAAAAEDSPLPGHIHVTEGGGGGSRANDAAYLGPKFGSIVVGAEGGGLRNSARPDALPLNRDERRHLFRRLANDHFLQRRRTAEMDAYTQSYEQALQLMERRDVFDLAKEPESLLERYGAHPLGKQCLMARRLLEHGVTFVQVSHSNYDTHNENFNFHLEQMGEFDQAYSGLLEDLAERGMLESTLVVVMSEFGRTPRINQYYGRDHWSKAWSIVMAGCGIQNGAVIGQTNDTGTEVIDREVDHRHLFHTYLRAVGLDSTGVFQVSGREMPMADPSAGPIEELLA